MGVDVTLYAEGEITDEEITAATEYLKARCWIADDYDGKWPLLSRESYDWFPAPRVELSNNQRYYGPGYERGDWPGIYGAIRLMQAAFPDRKVFYGGDSSDVGEECTEEFLAAMWEHFLGPHGDDYRISHKAWMEKINATPIGTTR
jgi:hypothetical protein